MRILLFFLSLLAAANRAKACSCDDAIEVGQQIKSATAVFVGTVTSVEPAVLRTSVAYFRVSHAIKGTAEGSTIAVDYAEGSDCRAPVATGLQIVVIAYGSAGNLATSKCSAWLVTREPEEIRRLLNSKS